MAIQRSTVVDALDANLNELFQDGLTDFGGEYEKIFNIESSDKQSEADSYESGFTSMPEKDEGVAATYDTVIAGIKKTYTHKTYALGYEITEEAIEDNLRTADTFNKLPRALARSAMETIEVTAANVVNQGFSGATGAAAGYDGQYLFSESHPTLDGSTASNQPSTMADLSVTTLTAGLTAVEKYTDERGLKRPTKAVTLAVPADLWNVAEELLGSEYKPYVANNEVNALQKKDLRYFVWHYLTDTDGWVLLSEKSNHKMKFFWRVRLGALRRGTDFDTTNLKHLARMRFSVGYSHWMGTYGSSGG